MKLSSIPFSYHWIITRNIAQSDTVLDLGCGDGEFSADLIAGNQWKLVGVELYPDSIKRAKAKGIYQKIIKADLTKLPKILPKSNVVLASQVIEHLPKKKGQIFLNEIEKFALRRVIVSTPFGFVPFHQLERGEQDQNPYQKHLSGWSVKDFEKRGYKVYGQGLRFIYQSSYVKKIPGKLFIFINALSFLAAPITYFYPQLAMYMIAVKEINHETTSRKR